MTGVDLNEFMRPGYWEALQRSVDQRKYTKSKARMSSLAGSVQYARDIGRKFAESSVEAQALEREIAEFDAQLL